MRNLRDSSGGSRLEFFLSLLCYENYVLVLPCLDLFLLNRQEVVYVNHAS